MIVKINNKQQSDDWTTEEQQVTTDVWQKWIPDELPDGRFWRIFSLTKMSCYTVGLLNEPGWETQKLIIVP